MILSLNVYHVFQVLFGKSYFICRSSDLFSPRVNATPCAPAERWCDRAHHEDTGPEVQLRQDDLQEVSGELGQHSQSQKVYVCMLVQNLNNIAQGL